MLPRSLYQLSTHIEGDRIILSYLRERDHVWLGALLAETARFEGAKLSELRLRLVEPLPVHAPKAKLRLARYVLEASLQHRVVAALAPAEARWRAFRARARTQAPRDAVLEAVAREAGVSGAELEAALFGDLRSESTVPRLPLELSASALAAATNLELVSSLVARAAQLSARVSGGARSLSRAAQRSGLLSVVRPACSSGEDAVCLDISGPFSIFRRTALYARALAALVPRLLACSDFELQAECVLGPAAQRARLIVRSSDPLGRSPAPELSEDAVAARFAGDFARLAPGFELRHDPEPLRAGAVLFLPDFELWPTRAPEQRWWLEIVRFWTAAHVAEKLTALSAAGYERVVFCVDERGGLSTDALPANARLVRYRRRVDVRAVLELIASDQA